MLHDKDRVLPIVYIAVLAGSLFAAAEDPAFRWGVIVSFVVAIVLSLVIPAVREKNEKRHRTAGGVTTGAYARKGVRNPGWPDVTIGDRSLLIRTYPYAFSSFSGEPSEIAADRIVCVFASTDPAVVVDGKEILFLPSESKDDLTAFAARNAIPASEIPEVWSLLAEPFIDQPYGTEAQDLASLEELGYGREEVVALRKRIEPVMLSSTFFTMEWFRYTTQDVLRAFLLLAPAQYTRDFYWNVMAVALRPYPSR